jgi:L-alanine-DL-glutamate epimerase-like enolase superfamily enzyme
MKIVGLRITSVNVPFKATLRWACGVETGTTRGIIEVVTENCIVGLGETYGGAGMEHAIETARPFVIGLDAAGKSLGLPVYRLLGGKTRDRIEFGA